MWTVDIELVEPWLSSLDDRSLEQVVAAIELLQERGPSLGRPLVAGDKAGNWRRWYTKNIPVADDLLDNHLARLEGR